MSEYNSLKFSFANSITCVVSGINCPYFFFFKNGQDSPFLCLVTLDFVLDIVLFCVDLGFSYINSKSIDLIISMFVLANQRGLGGAQTANTVPWTAAQISSQFFYSQPRCWESILCSNVTWRFRPRLQTEFGSPLLSLLPFWDAPKYFPEGVIAQTLSPGSQASRTAGVLLVFICPAWHGLPLG